MTNREQAEQIVHRIMDDPDCPEGWRFVDAIEKAIASRVDRDALRGLVIEMRRYIIHHGLLIGECVAWNELKNLTGVG